MASNNSKALSADIFEISDFVHELKKDYVNIPDETLYLGIFGYLSEGFSSLFQNAVVMAAEYSNESIPAKAKFEKNIIANALGLGISDINAKPANMEVMILFKKDDIEKNLYNDTFVLSREYPIYIGDFEFHLDYDLVLKRNTLATSDQDIYTATYDLTDVDGGEDSYWNTVSNINNPYLKTPAIYNAGDIPTIGVYCSISQVSLLEIENKILTNNVIENKTMTFQFEDQLCDFRVLSTTNGVTTILTPIYEGTYDSKIENYCYYQYLDSNTIRVKFDSNVKGYPTINTILTIQAQTTKGEAGNFEYSENVVMSYKADADMEHLEYPHKEYSNIYMDIKPSASTGGQDRKDIDELRKNIAKEAVSRGSITSTTDLENYFNAIDTEYSNTFFFKKEDNVLTRLYSSFIVMKDKSDNIIPTNTIDIELPIDSSFVSNQNTESNGDDVLYIPAMTKLYYTKGSILATSSNVNKIRRYIYDILLNAVSDPLKSHVFEMSLENDTEFQIFGGDANYNQVKFSCYDNQNVGSGEDMMVQQIQRHGYRITSSMVGNKHTIKIKVTINGNSMDLYTITGIDDCDGHKSAGFGYADNFRDTTAQIIGVDLAKLITSITDESIQPVFKIMVEKDGAMLPIDTDTGGYIGSLELNEDLLNATHFEYALPFSIMSKLSTQVCSCFLNNFDISRSLEFEGTNSSNETQFIASNLIWKRDTTSSDEEVANTYTLSLDVMENDSSDTIGVGDKRIVLEEKGGQIVGTPTPLPIGTNISSEAINTLAIAEEIVNSVRSSDDDHETIVGEILANYTNEISKFTSDGRQLVEVILSTIDSYNFDDTTSDILECVVDIQDIILRNSICKVKALAVFRSKDKAGYAIADEVIIKANNSSDGYVYTVNFNIKTTGNVDANNNIEMYLNWAEKESGVSDKPHYTTDENPVPIFIGYDVQTELYFLTYKDLIKNDNGYYEPHPALSNPEQTSQETKELNREVLCDRDKLWATTDQSTGRKGSKYFAISNVYKVTDGTSFMFNYSDIINCSIVLSDDASTITVKSLPVVGYDYISDALNMKSFINELEKRRNYIEYALEVLEDSTAIDFKFVNTYGPSRIFVICDQPTAKSSSDYVFLDNVQISLHFAVKLTSASDTYIIDYIKSFIKEEIEKLDELSEVHIPNIAADVKRQYDEQIVYFEYLGTSKDSNNSYINRTKQHISKYNDDEIKKSPDYVPEFINIALTDGDYSPDITIITV